MENQQKHQFLLTQLVLMFQTAALQHMGKLKSPMTDKIEKDLQQAQISIDMLDMLYSRMKSSLSLDEEKMFSVVLQELKLNYVDEVAKSKSSHENSASSEPAPTA